MRLTCPNCSAQYEVPDEVIPEDGRDVQCSNCDQTWFQAKHPADATAEPTDVESETAPVEDEVTEAAPVSAEEEAPEAEEKEQPTEEPAPEPKPEPEPEPEPEPHAEKATPSKTGNVDPAVASILQEEAAREAELRAEEGGDLETQPDLALDAAPEPKVEPTMPAASETAEDAGQKDALPDVEAINSSMRSDDATTDTEKPARKSGGFVRGFALMLIIGVVLYLIYGNAQQISEAVPQADPVLDSYVSLVDQARVWLETQAGSGASQN
ncbi:zinc-ribbon domain-containing protein [Rhodobacteraceae bacterium B1Z28]|uniref:Zinc-ribbon domain-containing protein n=1 Tax=Ruegeria haliotis TaxID=2747601 RepID=A0ABX2PSD6_9RHOB|nr:zinc-ribbon domain-containing protein [Ruegeria haliotis]NVO56566.1 zinc-ribbon domain-containing protein [Ruegeria haliotis]